MRSGSTIHKTLLCCPFQMTLPCKTITKCIYCAYNIKTIYVFIIFQFVTMSWTKERRTPYRTMVIPCRVVIFLKFKVGNCCQVTKLWVNLILWELFAYSRPQTVIIISQFGQFKSPRNHSNCWESSEIGRSKVSSQLLSATLSSCPSLSVHSMVHIIFCNACIHLRHSIWFRCVFNRIQLQQSQSQPVLLTLCSDAAHIVIRCRQARGDIRTYTSAPASPKIWNRKTKKV